jgi:hypothetical protein
VSPASRRSRRSTPRRLHSMREVIACLLCSH